MGLFRRKATTQDGGATGLQKERRGYGRAKPPPYSMATRPPFRLWLRHTFLDILTMAALGALGLGLYMADPVPNRAFAVTYANGEIVYPQFAYPLRREVVPIWLAAVLASLVPIAVFLLMQVRVRSFWDVNNAVLGLLYSLITAAVFQVFVKWLIGGLRPHFLAVCQPQPPVTPGVGGNGFQDIYYTREICTGDRRQINDSLESFPSGHTTAAFAGFVFLYLYLNAKLKVFADYHPHMWKLALLYAPILGAVLIGGALTIDLFHNWYDIVAGAVIGTVMAFSAYRMVYAAIWDWRFNHIPLSRVSRFPYASPAGADLFDAVATHRAGWDHGYGHGAGIDANTASIGSSPVGYAPSGSAPAGSLPSGHAPSAPGAPGAGPPSTRATYDGADFDDRPRAAFRPRPDNMV